MQKETQIIIFCKWKDGFQEERKNKRKKKSPNDYMTNLGFEKRLSKCTAIWVLFFHC